MRRIIFSFALVVGGVALGDAAIAAPLPPASVAVAASQVGAATPQATELARYQRRHYRHYRARRYR